MLAKVDSVEAYNDRVTATSKAEHEERLKAHEEKTQVKGRGLALFSVVCEFLFIAFCWYRERYEYKTAIQYAGFGDEEEETAPQEQSKIGNSGAPLPYRQHNSTNTNGIKGETTQRRPIGFYTGRQAEDQNTGIKTHSGEVIVLTKTYKNTEYLDTFTIEHKGKRYRLTDVERFCRTYRDRMRRSEKEGNTNTANNRRTQLEYWENRKGELLAKIEEAGKQ